MQQKSGLSDLFRTNSHRLFSTSVLLLLHGAVLPSSGWAQASQEVRRLRETRDCRGCNLEAARLQNAYLRNAYLSEAHLTDADLQGADLQGANLRRANLTNADLRNADLRNANLQGADLQGAELRGTQIEADTLDEQWLLVWQLVNAPDSATAAIQAQLSEMENEAKRDGGLGFDLEAVPARFQLAGANLRHTNMRLDLLRNWAQMSCILLGSVAILTIF